VVCDCEDACRESSDEYRIIVYNVLEKDCSIVLTHTQFVKAIPSKKLIRVMLRSIINLVSFYGNRTCKMKLVSSILIPYKEYINKQLNFGIWPPKLKRNYDAEDTTAFYPSYVIIVVIEKIKELNRFVNGIK
jgi:hypothetical protein